MPDDSGLGKRELTERRGQGESEDEGEGVGTRRKERREMKRNTYTCLATPSSCAPCRSTTSLRLILGVIDIDVELVSELCSLVPLCLVSEIDSLKVEKRTPLDTLDLVLERLLVHLPLFDLLDLDLFSVFLEISLSFGSFGFLDALSVLSVSCR